MNNSNIKVEVSLGELDSFTIGIYIVPGEDEYGDFNMLVIGIGIIEVAFFKYK